MNQRIAIDRLDIDLRGIDPAVAEATVRLLGPALQAAFAGRPGRTRSSGSIDAGRIAATSEPQALADRLAQCVVQRTSDEG